MNQLVFDIVSQQFTQTLKSLKGCLLKAKLHAETQKFNPDLYLDTKLAPDMFPLSKQIQMVSDNAKGAVARLSLKDAPKFEDQEKSFDDLIVRLDKTIEYVSSFSAKDFHSFQDAKVTFPWYPGKYLEGHDYLVTFALPNFYFHVTTVYALLRHAGVPVGKGDFLGTLNWKNIP